MSLLERIDREHIGAAGKSKRTVEVQILDALVLKHYPEMCKAIDIGYTWAQIYEAFKEELKAQGVWVDFWHSSKVYNIYMDCRSFKNIEEALSRYEKGELTSGK